MTAIPLQLSAIRQKSSDFFAGVLSVNAPHRRRSKAFAPAA